MNNDPTNTVEVSKCIEEQRKHLERLRNKCTYLGLPFSERLCKLAITDWWLEEVILRVREDKNQGDTMATEEGVMESLVTLIALRETESDPNRRKFFLDKIAEIKHDYPHLKDVEVSHPQVQAKIQQYQREEII